LSSLPNLDLLRGYLPPGIHQASHDEIRDRLVSIAPKPGLWPMSDRRKVLFSGYERLIEALTLAGINTEQWIGGSFVSRTDAPNDIDLINLCSVEAFEKLSPEVQAMVSQYFKGEQTAKHCHCDSYFAPAAPVGHPLDGDFAIIHNYWKKKLGHDREGYPKGIIARFVESTAITATELSDASAA